MVMGSSENDIKSDTGKSNSGHNTSSTSKSKERSRESRKSGSPHRSDEKKDKGKNDVKKEKKPEIKEDKPCKSSKDEGSKDDKKKKISSEAEKKVISLSSKEKDLPNDKLNEKEKKFLTDKNEHKSESRSEKDKKESRPEERKNEKSESKNDSKPEAKSESKHDSKSDKKEDKDDSKKEKQTDTRNSPKRKKSPEREKSSSPAKKMRRKSPLSRPFNRHRPFGIRRPGFVARGMGGPRPNPMLLRRIETERILRRREREKEIQEAERRRMDLLRTQREIERKAREGVERLERAKEKLRQERERLEREKNDLLRIQREKARNQRDKSDRDRDSHRDRFKMSHKGGYDGPKSRSSILDKKRGFDSKDLGNSGSLLDSRKVLSHRLGASSLSSTSRAHDLDLGLRLPKFDPATDRSGSYETRAAEGYRRYGDGRRAALKSLIHDRDYRRGATGPMNDEGNGPGYYRGSSSTSRIPHDNAPSRDGRGGRDDWTSLGDLSAGSRGPRRNRGPDKSVNSFSLGYGMDTRYSGDERGGRILPGSTGYHELSGSLMSRNGVDQWAKF